MYSALATSYPKHLQSLPALVSPINGPMQQWVDTFMIPDWYRASTYTVQTPMSKSQEFDFNKIHTTIVVKAEQRPLCDLSFRDLFTSDIDELLQGITLGTSTPPWIPRAMSKAMRWIKVLSHWYPFVNSWTLSAFSFAALTEVLPIYKIFKAIFTRPMWLFERPRLERKLPVVLDCQITSQANARQF